MLRARGVVVPGRASAAAGASRWPAIARSAEGRGAADRPARRVGCRIRCGASGAQGRGGDGDEAKTRKVRAKKSSRLVDVTFVTEYACKPGETIVVAGEHQALGSWQPSLGLALKWHEGNLWKGKCQLDTRATHAFKCVTVSASGQPVRWQQGKNRAVDIHDVDSGAALVAFAPWDGAKAIAMNVDPGTAGQASRQLTAEHRRLLATLQEAAACGSGGAMMLALMPSVLEGMSSLSSTLAHMDNPAGAVRQEEARALLSEVLAAEAELREELGSAREEAGALREALEALRAAAATPADKEGAPSEGEAKHVELACVPPPEGSSGGEAPSLEQREALLAIGEELFSENQSLKVRLNQSELASRLLSEQLSILTRVAAPPATGGLWSKLRRKGGGTALPDLEAVEGAGREVGREGEVGEDKGMTPKP